MKLTLDPGAAALLDTLHAAGYAAYAVGGCVRDSLLGRTAHDWDLCTSALPQQVMELFGTEQCIPTGLQHGTVTIKYGGQLYETTTFRTEGSYTDGRHPDEVQFVPDVREDLARRDFTINAMAYNEAEGLVDPFGGQKDLQNGLLRAVGEPQQRFTEDALRILRLYRFAARFGFAIDPPTAQAAQELCAHLDCVSVERIEEELAKLLEDNLDKNSESGSQSNSGIQVYIGEENGMQDMKDCSVVTARYDLGDGVQGTLGVVGPKRMDYEKVVGTLKNLRDQLDAIYKKNEP